MIIEHLDDIDEIFITLDTHYRLHIAHACSWRRGIAGMVGDVTYAVGDNPLPFTRQAPPHPLPPTHISPYATPLRPYLLMLPYSDLL